MTVGLLLLILIGIGMAIWGNILMIEQLEMDIFKGYKNIFCWVAIILAVIADIFIAIFAIGCIIYFILWLFTIKL